MSEPKVWRPGELWVMWDTEHGETDHEFFYEDRSRCEKDCLHPAQTTGRYVPAKVITGDPADRKRIAELEGSMKESIEWLRILHNAVEQDKKITAAELRAPLNRLDYCL